MNHPHRPARSHAHFIPIHVDSRTEREQVFYNFEVNSLLPEFFLYFAGFPPQRRRQQQRLSVSNLTFLSTQSKLVICIILVVRHTLRSGLLTKIVRTKTVISHAQWGSTNPR